MESGAPLLIDTHIHLDHPQLKDSLPSELSKAMEQGVGAFVVPGVGADGWERIFALCDSFPALFAAPGLHPMAATSWTPEVRARLEALLDQPKCVALGEVGLDGSSNMPESAQQKKALRAQIALARAARKPLLIHCHKGWGELMGILREEKAVEVGGILHGFSAGEDIARQAMDLGFVIGIGSLLTLPNARKVPELVKSLPLDALVLETDAPDQSPHPFRDEQGRPAHLLPILDAFAALRDISRKEAAEATTANARRILKDLTLNH